MTIGRHYHRMERSFMAGLLLCGKKGCDYTEQADITEATEPKPVEPKPNPVLQGSDSIVPHVHDNEFSRDALDKVMRSGRDKSMRRTMLHDLYNAGDKSIGLSSSQFEYRYGWLHQSASAALTGLEKEGLVRVHGGRINSRGNREGIYVLTAQARAAWDYETH